MFLRTDTSHTQTRRGVEGAGAGLADSVAVAQPRGGERAPLALPGLLRRLLAQSELSLPDALPTHPQRPDQAEQSAVEAVLGQD